MNNKYMGNFIEMNKANPGSIVSTAGASIARSISIIALSKVREVNQEKARVARDEKRAINKQIRIANENMRKEEASWRKELRDERAFKRFDSFIESDIDDMLDAADQYERLIELKFRDDTEKPVILSRKESELIDEMSGKFISVYRKDVYRERRAYNEYKKKYGGS